MLKFRKSAFKHGISRERIEQVLSDEYGPTLWIEIHPDTLGRVQDMVVGYDNNGMLLEIGLTYVEETIFIFHAAKASFNWRLKHKEEFDASN